jgi:hypothetical protein
VCPWPEDESCVGDAGAGATTPFPPSHAPGSTPDGVRGRTAGGGDASRRSWLAWPNERRIVIAPPATRAAAAAPWPALLPCIPPELSPEPSSPRSSNSSMSRSFSPRERIAATPPAKGTTPYVAPPLSSDMGPPAESGTMGVESRPPRMRSVIIGVAGCRPSSNSSPSSSGGRKTSSSGPKARALRSRARVRDRRRAKKIHASAAPRTMSEPMTIPAIAPGLSASL